MISYSLPSNFLDIDDKIKIHYLKAGRGKHTIIFIHGLANYADVWHKNISHLKNHFTCYAIDLPGCGLSSAGEFDFSISFYVDVLNIFIEKLALKNVVLCGHSMGGQIAILSALKNPESIQQLILCAPSGFEYFNPAEAFMFKQMIYSGKHFFTNESQLMTALRQSFHHLPNDAQKIFKDMQDLLHSQNGAQWNRMVQRSIAAMLDEPVFFRLKNVQCPVLVIQGEKDFFIPNKLFHNGTSASVAELGSRQIGNSQLKLIPDAGHFVFYEKAEVVNEYILEFLS